MNALWFWRPAAYRRKEGIDVEASRGRAVMMAMIAVPASSWGLVLGALFIVALFPASALAMPSEKPFEIIPGSFHLTPSTYQAGAH